MLALSDAWGVWFDENETLKFGSQSCGSKPPPRILVLEDTDYIRDDMIQALKERTDWEVFEAARLADGLNMLRTQTESGQPFHIIIADYSVGSGEYGTELLAEAQKISPNSYRILVTGGSADDRLKAARDTGAIQRWYLRSKNKVGELSDLIEWVETQFAAQAQNP